MTKEIIYQIETNIDDMDPRIYGGLMDKLFAEGALDVFYVPVYGKHNRPAVVVTVLCEKSILKNIVEIIFRETTSFGIRYWPAERKILERKFKDISTPYGKVKAKVGSYKGKIYTITPEYRDCSDLAKRKKIPIKDILNQAGLWKKKD